MCFKSKVKKRSDGDRGGDEEIGPADNSGLARQLILSVTGTRHC